MATETETRTRTEGEQDDDAGPFKRWVSGSISQPGRAYRPMFWLVTIFFLVTTLFPFYWLLMVALTPEGQLQDVLFTPNGFNPGVFVEIFQILPFHRYMFNSFVIATVTTAFVLVVASLAGYVFGRLRFPGKSPLMLLVLLVSFFPPAAFFIPLNDLFNANIDILEPVLSNGSLYNTPYALVIPMSALFMPLAIFILTTFYSQIPDGLEDAARVEGTTRLGALFRVIIPLSAPGVATAGVLTFIGVYNEFFFSFLMTDGQPQNWAPVLQGILGFQGQYQTLYNAMAAASIVAVLPMAILVVVAQEKIVSGLTAGGLKE
ncbi:carbohydrate ABC transporter permease [Halalkalicoccus jeotgali]|uniref:Binding-protein-dependent transport systems inner membrane component n=1 Tax=Halalkalicoccus jeotgali (strain DSM 18796 / CECT 7217 / JCM 14584 / KCTC 4019 / B3) TaxID=795797 RepID=D8JAV2_HALJB|nr:carbohydrate ABC transporter permease [Halalkalicoccus jeotgali]ADJ14824.1 binding-protein-dependent transport systems inner membrane component [Halalkalicoccus jeotgali B3]ELY39407.1 binding-protein-dependent transport systems inner membrane component [Halalkalicoccus jeotgali B3]